MRWRNRNESTNVEDRRGRWSGGAPGVPIRGKAGLLLVIIVVVAGFYGIDLTSLLTGGGSATSVSVNEPYTPTPEEQELARFTAVALKTTEETWRDIFHASGHVYPEPKLVLYSGATDTACGYGQSAMGPFYCPVDETVYIDLSFYRDMKTHLGGGGDFAQGYVIAHEVGHHVQHVLGIDKELQRTRRFGASQKDANRLSVMMELQADCFAGVWGHVMEREGILEPGDLEQALGTAAAIGDDRLQRQRSGRVVPDSFTHGTSEQRYTWFKRGFDSGNPNECNTFDALRQKAVSMRAKSARMEYIIKYVPHSFRYRLG